MYNPTSNTGELCNNWLYNVFINRIIYKKNKILGNISFYDIYTQKMKVT